MEQIHIPFIFIIAYSLAILACVPLIGAAKDNTDYVVIGKYDNGTDTAFPNLLMTKWHNETKLNVFVSGISSVQTSKTGGKGWSLAGTGVNIYTMDDGNVEVEAILASKPPTNRFSFNITSVGLLFYYQPALNATAPEIAGTACNDTDCWDKDGKIMVHMPENVVGSYAVYHSSKNGDYSAMGGENYATGKAFHIYRPKIIDSKNDSVWASLNISNGIMTVTIPQAFLNSATYPITIDPTFGNSDTTNEGYYSQGANREHIWHFSLTETGNVSKVSFYTRTNSDTHYLKALIYSDNSGQPLTLLASSAGVAINTTETWYDFPLSVTLSAGTYWLGVVADSQFQEYFIETGQPDNTMYWADYANSYTTPVTTWTDYANSRARITPIYATYALPGTYTNWASNSTNGTTAGTYVSHNVYWTTNATALSGYIFSFYNGSDTSQTTQTADLESGTQTKTAIATKYYTTYRRPTTSQVDGGLNWTNPTSLYVDDASNALASAVNRHMYWGGFSMGIPEYTNNLTINGILMTVKGSANASSTTVAHTVAISNDSGVTRCPTINTITYTSSTNTNKTAGNIDAGVWGCTWTAAQANNIWIWFNSTTVPVSRQVRATTAWIYISYNISDTEVNGTDVYYNSTALTLYPQITNISFIVNVSTYANSASINRANNNPQLYVLAYNGSQFLNVGYIQPSATGNYTVYTTDSTILSAWSTLANRNIIIKPLYVDYINDTYVDSISWNSVWIRPTSTDTYANDSWVPFTGTANWSNVTKYINSTAGATIQWRVYANNSDGLWNSTNIFQYTTTPSRNITDCAVISTGGIYTQINNITSAFTCINITASNVEYDCNGYYLNGPGVQTENAILIYVPPTENLNNITIKNCHFYSWFSGVSFGLFSTYLTTNSTIINSTFEYCEECMWFFRTYNVTLRDSTINNATTDGVFLDDNSRNDFVINTNITNGINGIQFAPVYANVTNNTVTGCIIANNSVSGINKFEDYDDFVAEYNLVYNNILNNTLNYMEYGPIDNNKLNYWNTTNQSGTNIMGGSYLGGNAWAHPDGTGYSQTCPDSNADGFCDSPLNLSTMTSCSGSSCGQDTDYLPLKIVIEGGATDATFSIAMPSNYAGWTEITGTSEGAATASDWISFNFTSLPQTGCQPYQAGSSGYAQNGIGTPIYYIDNTGNAPISISIRLGGSPPSGITLKANSSCVGTCTSSQSSLVTLSTSYADLIVGLAEASSFANISLYSDLQAGTGDGTSSLTIYIKSTG